MIKSRFHLNNARKSHTKMRLEHTSKSDLSILLVLCLGNQTAY